jgi:hypothetical protein
MLHARGSNQRRRRRPSGSAHHCTSTCQCKIQNLTFFFLRVTADEQLCHYQQGHLWKVILKQTLEWPGAKLVLIPVISFILIAYVCIIQVLGEDVLIA